jgi:hypothetical protein
LTHVNEYEYVPDGIQTPVGVAKMLMTAAVDDAGHTFGGA